MMPLGEGLTPGGTCWASLNHWPAVGSLYPTSLFLFFQASPALQWCSTYNLYNFFSSIFTYIAIIHNRSCLMTPNKEHLKSIYLVVTEQRLKLQQWWGKTSFKEGRNRMQSMTLGGSHLPCSSRLPKLKTLLFPLKREFMSGLILGLLSEKHCTAPTGTV